MKRFSIIIGCAGLGRQYRPGIEKDVDNFVEYLKSNKGGAWYDNEILPLKNECKKTILDALDNAKRKYDYILVVFSGHGNYSTSLNKRRLYTNEEEFFYETDLQKISKKQLTIIDSCACVEREISEHIRKSFSALMDSQIFKKDYRKLFDEWIESCPDQSIEMYSCQEGEESSDTDNGGLYVYNLIIAAKSVSDELNCLRAHEIATPEVINSASKRRQQQHPVYISSCKHGNVLPFSVGK
jgi:Caspase domain.